MKGYIYFITNTETGKYYIGSTTNPTSREKRHWRDLRKGAHHCVPLQRSHFIHGQDKFTFNIIEIHESTQKELLIIEQNHLDSVDWSNVYNTSKFASGGDNISYHPDKEIIQEKKKETIKNKIKSLTKQERSKIYGRYGNNNGMYGKTHTKKTRKKLSKFASEQAKGKSDIVGINREGKTNIEVFGKEKAKRISKKLSKFAKTRTNYKNPFYGKHHTYKTKEMLRSKSLNRKKHESIKDKIKHTQIKFVSIDGVIYYGVSEAARELGCSPANIVYKLKSSKYPNYRYINKREVAV